MLYVLPLKGVLLMIQGIVLYLLASNVHMWRDSAEASSSSMLAGLSVCSDSVSSSIVKIEYLFNDLMGSTDDCLFTVTQLQNPTQSSLIFLATWFHYCMKMLLHRI